MFELKDGFLLPTFHGEASEDRELDIADARFVTNVRADAKRIERRIDSRQLKVQ